MKVLTIILLFVGLHCGAQGKYIIIPSAAVSYAIKMRNTQSTIYPQYWWGDTLTTKGGRYIANFINLKYYPVIDSLVNKYHIVLDTPLLPLDSFRANMFLLYH